MLGSLPFLACLVMLSVLSYLGIHVLKREIVFIDIAVAQIVAVGASWAHLQLRAHEDTPGYYAAGLLSAVLAAAFFSFARKRITQVPLEAIIGVSYAVAAAGYLFLPGVYEDAHVHVQEMLGGSILWVRASHVVVCLAVFALVAVVFALLHGRFARISEDYEGAGSEGAAVGRWDFLFYTLVGVVITFAVRVGGVVLVFAFLIMPATISACFATRWGSRLAVAWATGILASFLGLAFAHRLDFSVGPSVALLLGICLILAALWRALRPAFAVPMVVAAIAGYAGLLAAHPALPPSAVPEQDCCPGAPSPVHHHPEHRLRGAGIDEPRTEDVLERARQATGARELESLFGRTADDSARAEIVSIAADVDISTGVALALAFLDDDPPLFYRQTVIERLEKALGRPLGYDVSKPAADPGNQEAVAALRTRLMP